MDIGYGVFDAVYTPDAGVLPQVGYGRDYVDKSRWTPEVAQNFEETLSGLRGQWAALNKTVRLFKSSWQGQELSREVN